MEPKSIKKPLKIDPEIEVEKRIEKNRALERPRAENVSSQVRRWCGCFARGVPTLKQRGLQNEQTTNQTHG